MGYIMALDQGTTSSRAFIYDENFRIIAIAQKPVGICYLENGWVEQNPEEIWDSIVAVGREVISKARIVSSQIDAIGITNQRETSLLWNKHTGEPIYNAIVWQDRRTADFCNSVLRYHEEAIREKTGLVVDPYFSSTKLSWLLDYSKQHGLSADDLLFGTVDSFLLWRLTGGSSHLTDATNASRTQLFNIREQSWDQDLLQLFDVPQSILPAVCDSAFDFGVADAKWFGSPIPICGVAGDQQAALIGQGCVEVGMSKSTYGTGCFMVTNLGEELKLSRANLLTTIAYRLDGKPTYALEGSVFVAGSAINWLREKLKFFQSDDQTEAAYERCGGDSNGVYFIPAFTGLGAPHWDPAARASISGLTLDTEREHIITALLQGISLQTMELCNSMTKDGVVLQEIRIDGGMAKNKSFCQCLADLTKYKVSRPDDTESTVRGAAVLAGLGCGKFSGIESATRNWALDTTFEPSLSTEKRDDIVSGYQKALQQSSS